jgi:hypothetical protein
MCEVEIEFAVDIVPESKGSELVLKLLQVRPACEVLGNEKISIDTVTESMHKVFVKSTKALGSGRFSNIDYILSVPSDSFDSAHTSEMAEEISRINEQLREKGASYLLVGPGRWGSSDPWLGIPVAWSDISEAKMIVETAIPGYRIEPSQGTHFFQNITSLGVGYLTIDTVLGDGHVDEAALEQLECIHCGTFVKLYKAPEGFTGYIDRTTATSVIGC